MGEASEGIGSDSERSAWHLKPKGEKFCPICGARVRVGTRHRWDGQKYVKRIRVCFGQDWSDEPL